MNVCISIIVILSFSFAHSKGKLCIMSQCLLGQTTIPLFYKEEKKVKV